MYWPNLNDDAIKNEVSKCKICLRARSDINQQKQPMQSYELPTYMYERVSMDRCNVTYRCIKHNMLVIVDQFSDWIDFDFLEDILTAASMCRQLKENLIFKEISTY
jgi:hypothetical protein